MNIRPCGAQVENLCYSDYFNTEYNWEELQGAD